MKKHNGMRPQDIVVLLKIASFKSKPWMGKDLAFSLDISMSEISESLNRSAIAGLLDGSKKKLMKDSFLDFLKYGLKYVFPQQPGPIVRGTPTAHSAPPLNSLLSSDELYVWADPEGDHRGQSIEPLHPGVIKAAKQDIKFYELISLVDALRVGRAREQELAIQNLKERIK